MGEIPLWKLKQEAREYIAKCDAEERTKTMNIKERIDGLTEQEAKAALEWCINFIYDTTDCDVCDNAKIINGELCPCVYAYQTFTGDVCLTHWIDRALKEALK